MNQQISVDVLLSLLSSANNKNALLEIDIANLKSQTQTNAIADIGPMGHKGNNGDITSLELESYESKIAALNESLEQTKNDLNIAKNDLDIANKKIASYVEICKQNENKFSSLKDIFNKSYLIPLELLPHEHHRKETDKIVREKEFDKLLGYGSFKLNNICPSCIKLCDNVVLKHIIDNCENLNDSIYGNSGLKFFTYVVASRKNNLEIVKYLIEEKNANLEEEYENKSTPIYFACQHSSFEVINLILDHNVRLGFENNDEKTQFDYLKNNDTLTDDQKKIIEDRIRSIIASRITQNE